MKCFDEKFVTNSINSDQRHGVHNESMELNIQINSLLYACRVYLFVNFADVLLWYIASLFTLWI